MAEILTLKKALEMNLLDEFVRQEEARGIGPIDQAKLNAALTKIVKQPR